MTALPDLAVPTDEAGFRRYIGHALRVHRAIARLSQEELADKAGVSRNFVSAIERGTQGLDMWRLRQLTIALGIDLHALLEDPTISLDGRKREHR